MNQETNKIIESGLIEITKADYIVSKFKSYTEVAEEWATKAIGIVVTDENQVELINQAKEARLLLKSKRIEVEKIRKSLKEQSLNEGRLIDSVAKSLTSLIEPAEKHLELQEKFVEIKERERKIELSQERTKLLNPYWEVIDVNTLQLDIMTDEAFESILKFVKKELAEKIEIARIEKEEKEAQEKAEQDEKERINAENIKLKKEASERAFELQRQMEENNRIQKELEKATAKPTPIVLRDIEVNDPEIISNQIKEINQRVKEVCPTPEIGDDEHLDSIGIKSPQYYQEELGIEIEVIIAMERKIKELQQKNEIATNALKFCLAFIIHDNLRLNIENALKELKK
jgi:hypothetical protein